MTSLTYLLLWLPLAMGWVKDMENPGKGFYQGDMILNPEQMTAAKLGRHSYGSIRNHLWPKTIPYDYDAKLASSRFAMAVIQAAIDDYHKYTCLRFVKRTTQKNYLHFVDGGGCSSYVGMQRVVNTITLGSGCWNKGTTIHEIAHSLGFYHEQSRPDRDQYLKIHWENIPKNIQYNFNIQDDIDSKGSPYDYLSTMHYGISAFGNGKITIETKNHYYRYLIGNRNGFSQTDIIQLNNLYNCPKYTGPMPLMPTPHCRDFARNCDMYIVCNVPHIKKLCPFSCGTCRVSASRTVPPSWSLPPTPKGEATKPPKTETQQPKPETHPTKPPTKPPTQAKTKRPIATPPGKCSDKARNCYKWKSSCTTNKAIRETWCRQTCGVCSVVTSCKDRYPNCSRIVVFCNRRDSTGERVRKACKESCGQC